MSQSSLTFLIYFHNQCFFLVIFEISFPFLNKIITSIKFHTFKKKKHTHTRTEAEQNGRGNQQQASDTQQLCQIFCEGIRYVAKNFQNSAQNSQRLRRRRFGEESLLILRSLHAQPHEEARGPLCCFIHTRFCKFCFFFSEIFIGD